jgi:uncharacterized protein YtpQ (UPF0354 family)
MKITEQAIAYLKGSPLEDGRPVVTLSPKDSPVVRPYSGDLHVCYLVDKGQSYGYIQNHHLEDDGISADDLHQIGLRNLKHLIGQSSTRVQPYGKVFTFLAGGDFGASVMLLDEFWEGEFRKFVIGRYAAAIPARDVLAFCDVESGDGITELQGVINRVWPTGNHLISDKVYVRQIAGWRALSLDDKSD